MARFAEHAFAEDYYFKQREAYAMRFGEFKPASEAEYHDGYGRGEDIDEHCCYQRDHDIHNDNRTDLENQGLFREIEMSDW